MGVSTSREDTGAQEKKGQHGLGMSHWIGLTEGDGGEHEGISKSSAKDLRQECDWKA